MVEIFTPEELKKEVANKKWVFPYTELFAMYDEANDLVELVEDYVPENGLFAEGWRVFHFPRTSPIVKSSRREGTKSIFLITPGRAELKLIPAFAPIGIESAEVSGNEIKISYAGYGGGGVSASYCRGLAKGVKRIEIEQRGGGSKLGKAAVVLPLYKQFLVSVDDTDNEEEGATYALAHNIAAAIADGKNIRYITHGNAQLYPNNPNKTKNCFSTVIGFAIKPGFEAKITSYFRKELRKHTLSNHTGMCCFEGIKIPDEIKAFGDKAKKEFINEIDDVKRLAEENNVKTFAITGERGIIGALAAIGLHDDPDYASKLLEKYD